MSDLTKMCEVAMEEIDKIADKGLTTSNLDNVYKLVDIVKDIKTIEAMESEYSEYDGGNSYDGTDSMRGRGQHYVRGHYSREGEGGNVSNRYSRGNDSRSYASERYSQAKRDYRQSRAGKNDVMESLNEKMRELKEELKAMSKDSDFPEERAKIDKYVDMLDRVM